MGDVEQQFGGFWTKVKLERLAAYLPLFTTEFGDRFRTVYFDGFAGSGQIDQPAPTYPNRGFFKKTTPPPIEGSAVQALRNDPAFNKLMFVDREESHCEQLRSTVAVHFPHHAGRVIVRRGDANKFAIRLCAQLKANRHRAVFFFDPYGTQLDWATLEVVAKTKLADVWYLFPINAALRLLPSKAIPLQENVACLDRLLGGNQWANDLYRKWQPGGIFPTVPRTSRVPWQIVVQYFQNRLRSIFEHAEFKPLRLYAGRGSPLFCLFYVSSIPGSRDTHAVVQDILNISSMARDFPQRFLTLRPLAV